MITALTSRSQAFLTTRSNPFCKQKHRGSPRCFLYDFLIGQKCFRVGGIPREAESADPEFPRTANVLLTVVDEHDAGFVKPVPRTKEREDLPRRFDRTDFGREYATVEEPEDRHVGTVFRKVTADIGEQVEFSPCLFIFPLSSRIPSISGKFFCQLSSARAAAGRSRAGTRPATSKRISSCVIVPSSSRSQYLRSNRTEHSKEKSASAGSRNGATITDGSKRTRTCPKSKITA